MWETKLVTPISSSDWNNSQFGEDDGSSDGSGNFLSALDSKTDVSIRISNDYESLESGSLTGSSLLLDWHDFHDFILQLGAKEEINDLILFDWESKEIDFF